MTQIQTLDRPALDDLVSTGEPIHSHIVAGKDQKDGATLLMEARFEGTAVQALCGHRFIPSRDPKKFPPCSMCVEIFKRNTGKEDGWSEA